MPYQPYIHLPPPRLRRYGRISYEMRMEDAVADHLWRGRLFVNPVRRRLMVARLVPCVAEWYTPDGFRILRESAERRSEVAYLHQGAVSGRFQGAYAVAMYDSSMVYGLIEAIPPQCGACDSIIRDRHPFFLFRERLQMFVCPRCWLRASGQRLMWLENARRTCDDDEDPKVIDDLIELETMCAEARVATRVRLRSA